MKEYVVNYICRENSRLGKKILARFRVISDYGHLVPIGQLGS